MKCRREPAWKRLLHSLQFGSDLEAVEASKALPRCRSRNCIQALISLMLDSSSSKIGELAAWSLAWRFDRRLVPTFVACLRDVRLYDAVRGQAAEAFSLLLEGSRAKDKDWRAAESALLDALSDPSATVRFWSCFSLGALGSERAVAPLKSLRDHDTALVPGWWYVHEEAEDALDKMAGGMGAERVPIYLRAESRLATPTPTPSPRTG